MNTESYFLADLPQGTPISPRLIEESCDALRRNRLQHLLPLPTQAILSTLAELGAAWRSPGSPLRRAVETMDPELLGFTAPTALRGLDHFMSGLEENALRALIAQDLGDPGVLDGFVIDRALAPGRPRKARGAELLVHIAGGRLPVGHLSNLVLGLLTRSAQFIKCPSGGAGVVRLFAHALRELNPRLGSCIEIADWKGGTEPLDNSLILAADLLTVTGNDETVRRIRNRTNAATRVVEHGHKVSFGYVTKEAVSGFHVDPLLAQAGLDVAAWDQLGCLSPHVFYVESGGVISPEEFAQGLAKSLATLELELPRARLPVEEASIIATRRGFYEVRAAHSLGTRLWTSPGSTSWTVIYEEDPLFQLSCLNRFVYVKPVRDLSDVFRAADAVRGRVSTVGLAAPEHRAHPLSQQLADWGVPRICPVGRMQFPPLQWRHDGRPSLADLVWWTDWELS